MKTIKNYQSGSAHILLISMLVVGLMVALGFILWQNFLQPKNQSSTKDLAKELVQPKNSTSPTPTKEDESKFFDINEWGVKFRLSGALLETRVIAKQQNSGNIPNLDLVYYQFSTERILSTDSTCDGVVYLLRYTKLEQSTGQGGGGAVVLNTSPINGFYYVSSGPSAGPSCLAHPDVKEIKDSLKTIELK